MGRKDANDCRKVYTKDVILQAAEGSASSTWQLGEAKEEQDMLFTCQLCTQQTPFRKAYFFDKDMPLLAVGDIYMKMVGYL